MTETTPATNPTAKANKITNMMNPPTLIIQDLNTRCCGQCAVAMAADVSLQDSIKAFGHSHATSAKHLADALDTLGIKHGPFQRCKKGSFNAARAIVRLHWTKGQTSHWVLFWDCDIYCSVSGKNPDWSMFPNLRFTSFIPLTGPLNSLDPADDCDILLS